jgi:perosamine synthetase
MSYEIAAELRGEERMTSPSVSPQSSSVPFFRPKLTDAEVGEVVDTLRSGWLTTGPKVKRFEAEFAEVVGAKHAIGVNSCTAALHLAIEALNVKPGQGVLVPTMTFAATAEVLRYLGAIPILVDCDPESLNLDLNDADKKIEDLRSGRLPQSVNPAMEIVGIIPVHVGGMMLDINALTSFAERHALWIIEDAAHAFPAAWRANSNQPWQFCGQGTAAVSCFSFYANKTITTGEGGMATTNDSDLASRIRMMSLHGLSHDAWDRYTTSGSWDYKINAPGYKYNLTDIAAAIGIHQLARSKEMRYERQAVAQAYLEALSDIDQIEIPTENSDRIHSWHLFPIKLRLDRLEIDRNEFIEKLKELGIGCSVHWRPLHLHPYYAQMFGWRSDDLPVSSEVWKRLVSLPIFPGMLDVEVRYVARSVADLCARYSK